MRRFAVSLRPEQTRRRYFGAGVTGGQVTQKSAHHRQPPGRVARIGRAGAGRPVQGHLQRDRAAVATLVQAAGERPQRPFLVGRVISQVTAQINVGGGRRAGGPAHDVTGQGSATSRKAATSTAA